MENKSKKLMRLLIDNDFKDLTNRGFEKTIKKLKNKDRK